MKQNQKKSFNEIFDQLTHNSSKQSIYFFTREELTKLIFDVAFSSVLDSEYFKAIEGESISNKVCLFLSKKSIFIHKLSNL